MSRHGLSFHVTKKASAQSVVQKDHHAFTTTHKHHPKRTICFLIDIFQPIQQNIHHILLRSQFCGTKMSAMCDESMLVYTTLFTRLAQFCGTKLTAMCHYSIVAIYVGYFGDLQFF